MDSLTPSSHAEAVALFRHGILGALTQAQLERGQLQSALAGLATQRFRPPMSKTTRSYSVPTLERWYYAFRANHLEGLKPRPRSDKGRAQSLTVEQRQLLCDIRREFPSGSAMLLVRTLVADGRLEKGAVSATTVRRLFKEAGLDRLSQRASGGGKMRLRWEAEYPGALWHGDVCHGPALVVDGKTRHLRIHALMDDASRYVVALEAHHTEREVDMLGLFVRAMRRHGPPDALYLDNGSTYRGETLATACARLGLSLVHARPYDAPARGKMERFWRTLREGCLDFLGSLTSLHDVNVRLWAFLDAHYHQAPHAGLYGRAPDFVWRRPTNFAPTRACSCGSQITSGDPLAGVVRRPVIRRAADRHPPPLSPRNRLDLRSLATQRSGAADSRGRTNSGAPKSVFTAAPPRVDALDEKGLRTALTTRVRRRVRRDSTVSIAGKDYEVDGAHLAGRLVMLCRCLVDLNETPWVEFETRRIEVRPVDAVKNGRRARRRSAEAVPVHSAFDPPKALLDKATGRRPLKGGDK